MGYVSHADKALKILTDNPGKVIYRDDIAEDTGLTLEQVSVAVNRIAKSAFGKNIDVAIKGRAWAYHPNRATVVETPTRKVKVTPVEDTQETPALPKEEKPKVNPKGDVFERVGKSDSGEVIVRDERGILYKVVKL